MRSDYRNLYRTSRWKRLSKEFLCQYPVCNYCGSMSEVSDHVKPHKGDEILFYAWHNLQPLCKQCHDSIKAKIENGNKHVVKKRRVGVNGLPAGDSDHPWADK